MSKDRVLGFLRLFILKQDKDVIRFVTKIKIQKEIKLLYDTRYPNSFPLGLRIMTREFVKF